MGQRIYDKADFYLSRGNRKRLGRLLRRHRYLLNSQNSMLVFRAVWQYHGMLGWLLAQGVHPDCTTSPGSGTPLMHAAADGNLVAIRLLLDYGADTEARNENNELPLGYACAYEQWEAVKLLVERGADVNGIERDDCTHLDWMVIGNKEAGIRTLRDLGGLLFEELDHPRNP